MIKLLLIEDDTLIQRMYQRLFELEGFQFVCAENGEAGLTAVKNFQPALILLDLKMPVMNGLEVLAHLKANPATNTIPVIVLTNTYATQEIKEAMDGGAELVLIKSQTSPKNVINQVNSVLEKRSHAPTNPITSQPTSSLGPQYNLFS